LIDAIYALGRGSKRGVDWELRYSLRSLAAQPWVGDVYVVGERPDFLSDAVRHIPADDPYLHAKDTNIIAKYITGCAAAGTERVMLMSDDQYIMRPCEPDDIREHLEDPRTARKLLDSKQGSVKWARRVQSTVRYAVEHGYPGWVFEAHTPYLVERERYARVWAGVPWERGNGFTTHLYLNMTLTAEPPPKPPGHVLRLTRAVRHLSKCDPLFVNHNNPGLCPALREFIERRFPEPSRWEITALSG